MKLIKFKALGEDLVLFTTQYCDGGLAVLVETENGEPFCTLSVNLEETADLPEGAFYVKHWAENERLFAAVLELGLLEGVDAPVVSSGYIDGIEAYRLK